jgi:hypothetical protein
MKGPRPKGADAADEVDKVNGSCVSIKRSSSPQSDCLEAGPSFLVSTMHLCANGNLSCAAGLRIAAL